MNDYTVDWPFWGGKDGGGLCADDDPVLPTEVAVAARAWAARFNELFDYRYGWPDQATAAAHQAEGERLFNEVKRALPDDRVQLQFWESGYQTRFADRLPFSQAHRLITHHLGPTPRSRSGGILYALEVAVSKYRAWRRGRFARMADWTQGRSLTDWTDQSEVEKLLALLPVHELPALSAAEQTGRRVAAYNLFGIEAAEQDGGISFESGVGVLDQPLLAALDILFTRRFPYGATID